MIFSWRPDICVCVSVCVCVCARLSNFQITMIQKRLEKSSFGTAVKQSRPFNRDDIHAN